MTELSPLTTFGVGSAATPGWLFTFRDAIRSGRVGADDIAEAFADATRTAVTDQIDAGIDILCDGELRRMRFVYEMYDQLQGLRREPVGRQLGVPGYDKAPLMVAEEKVQAPNGLGIVDEYRALKAIAGTHPLKVAFPGPLTFAMNIRPGAAYGGDCEAGRQRLMDDLVTLVGDEIHALEAAGADFIQLDEPGFASPPDNMDFMAAAEQINRAFAGTAAPVRRAVHICFGNNASRPYVRRDMARLLPAIRTLDCSMLLLEFANREFADLEACGPLAEKFILAAGVIDVKSFHQESAEEVGVRIRRVLSVVPAERLCITADCGFSAIPRWLAKQKMAAMVAGTRLVRRELSL